MKPDKYFKVILGAALCSILVSVVAVLFSYRFYTASQKSNAAHQHSLQMMQATVDLLENRLAEIEKDTKVSISDKKIVDRMGNELSVQVLRLGAAVDRANQAGG